MCFLKLYFLHRIYTGKEINTYFLLINSILISVQQVLGKTWNRSGFFSPDFLLMPKPYQKKIWTPDRRELYCLSHSYGHAQPRRNTRCFYSMFSEERNVSQSPSPSSHHRVRLKERNDDTHSNLKQKKVNFKVWSEASLLSNSEYQINKNVFPAQTSCNKMFYCVTTERATK